MMTHVSLLNVCKKVGQTTILSNVNVNIQQGEFLVVVGPSGCGKSTLMRLIAGLEEISSGEIQMNQKCVNKIPAAKRDMAMVFQNYALYPHMTVFENMAYALRMRKLSKADINKRVTETAQLLHLTPFLERKPSELSGGQKQRVAMGRAMTRSPSVFLFDEPLSNLDAKLRGEMRHEIKKLHQQFRTTSVYVTHDQTEAMTMAERILVLNHGVVEQLGTPQDVYQKPASIFVAGFMGHYPINFIPARFNKALGMIESKIGIHLPVMEMSLDDYQELVLAIRPEHLQLASSDQKNSVKVRVEFVDDMGADKLIQTRCLQSGVSLNIRVNADCELSLDDMYLDLPVTKLHVFSKESGHRLGDWSE